MKEFVVKSPIYGYNGQGYQNKKFILTYFDDKKSAIEYKNRCNTAYEIGEKSSCSVNEGKFHDNMTHNNSYYFTGLSVAYKVSLEHID